MPSPSLSSEDRSRTELAAALAAVRGRWCEPCDHCDHRPVRLSLEAEPPCLLRQEPRNRLLVVARGARDELAIVPVVFSAAGAIGCPVLEDLVVLRPEADAPDDARIASVLDGAGAVTVAAGFGDPRVERIVRGALLAVAWRIGEVFPAVDRAVLGEPLQPVRVLADPAAPSYGRWPAPQVGWASIAVAVPWTKRPFREHVGEAGEAGAACAREDALRAARLPPLAEAAHPLAQALVLACLLGTAPPGGDCWTIGSVLLNDPDVVAARGGAFVLIWGDQLLRYLPPNSWEPLFAEPFATPGAMLALCDIARADAHVRVADRAAFEERAAPRGRALLPAPGGAE